MIWCSAAVTTSSSNPRRAHDIRLSRQEFPRAADKIAGAFYPTWTFQPRASFPDGTLVQDCPNVLACLVELNPCGRLRNTCFKALNFLEVVDVRISIFILIYMLQDRPPPSSFVSSKLQPPYTRRPRQK